MFGLLSRILYAAAASAAITLLVFDLLPGTYWSGTASGDEVTVNWEGGCSCGRKGPYFHNDVKRIMDSRGANRVVSPRKAQAFERLEQFLIQQG